jgi:hypothetical protein
VTGSTQDRRGPEQTRPTGGRSGGGVAFGSFNPTTITDARSGASEELAGRQRRYAITMAFRTACFIAMIFVPGVFRWILFGCAVFLPYVAVIFANQAHHRSAGSPVGGAEPGDAPAITTGPEQYEVISGDVEDGHDGRPG